MTDFAAKNAMINLVQSGFRELTVTLVKKSDDRPYNLSGVSSIVLHLPSAAGGAAQQAIGTISSEDLGEITFEVSSTVSALVKLGERQTAELSFTKAGKPIKILLQKRLNVFDAISA
jgi:hypothetical protein